QLLADLLPHSHDASTTRTHTAWRDWAPDEPISLTFGEHARRVHDIASMMLGAAGYDGRRWTDLVTALPNLPADIHELVVRSLRELPQDRLAANHRDSIWNALRGVIAHHRSYPSAPW